MKGVLTVSPVAWLRSAVPSSSSSISSFDSDSLWSILQIRKTIWGDSGALLCWKVYELAGYGWRDRKLSWSPLEQLWLLPAHPVWTVKHKVLQSVHGWWICLVDIQTGWGPSVVPMSKRSHWPTIDSKTFAKEGNNEIGLRSPLCWSSSDLDGSHTPNLGDIIIMKIFFHHTMVAYTKKET